MIKAIIFDMDGVIVDSESIHFKAYKKALEKYGVNLSKDDYIKYGVSNSYKLFLKSILKKYGVDVDISLIWKHKREYFKTYVNSNLRLMKDVEKILSNLYGKYKLAVCSSTEKDFIILILTNLNVIKYFDIITGGFDVERNKPFPDVYLETAKRLKLDSKDCLAIEDSENGVIAAKEAGMNCIAVPNDYTKLHDLSKADIVLNGLSEINECVVSRFS